MHGYTGKVNRGRQQKGLSLDSTGDVIGNSLWFPYVNEEVHAFDSVMHVCMHECASLNSNYDGKVSVFSMLPWRQARKQQP